MEKETKSLLDVIMEIIIISFLVASYMTLMPM